MTDQNQQGMPEQPMQQGAPQPQNQAPMPQGQPNAYQQTYQQTPPQGTYAQDPSQQQAPYGQQQYQQQPYGQQPYGQPQYQPQPDSGSFGWAVLGFFLPLVGLILFLVWRQTKPKCAKMAGIGAIVGAALSIIMSMFSTCAMVAMAPYYY